MFSIKPDADFANGNYWGLPSSFEMFNNYGKVFFESNMPRYLFNSIMITVPTVIGAVALSAMAGFALGIYKFRGNLLIFFMFIAGNFVPFQILMVPVRDLTIDLGLYDTVTGLVLFHIAFQTGFCTLFMRNFIKALPFPLIEAARVEGVAEWKIFWYVVLPDRRSPAPGHHVLLDAKALHRGPDLGRREVSKPAHSHQKGACFNQAPFFWSDRNTAKTEHSEKGLVKLVT